MLNTIFQKVDANEPLTMEEAVALLEIDPQSSAFYRLIGKANELTRREAKNRGYIFAQIGLNAAPCSGNCKFCSLARDYFSVSGESEKSADEVIDQVREVVESRADALFLMTTADYDQQKFLCLARQIKPMLRPGMEFVANIGDFDGKMAEALRDAGFTAVYHIVRLREGVDTDLPREQRLRTLDAIAAAGLKLIYCVEPIGSEHTNEELAEQMLLARDRHVDIMAVMRRVGVPGTPLAKHAEVSELRMVQIAAAARLVTRPKTSMNIHEPMKMALLAGVNQLYAELGVNPRDRNTDTEQGRGYEIEEARRMLRDAQYEV